MNFYAFNVHFRSLLSRLCSKVQNTLYKFAVRCVSHLILTQSPLNKTNSSGCGILHNRYGQSMAIKLNCYDVTEIEIQNYHSLQKCFCKYYNLIGKTFKFNYLSFYSTTPIISEVSTHPPPQLCIASATLAI